jgi:DprA winged helix domain
MMVDYKKHDKPSRRSTAAAADLPAPWAQFVTEFPTDESCVEELYRRDGGKLLTCHHCFQPLVHRKYGAREIECTYCHKTTRPMANTFFHGMRNPRAWLAILWFYEHGIVISGWKLHELSGIAQSSAANLLKKYATVIRNMLPEDGEIVPSELFSSVFTKRSRETPARKHPRAEEEELGVARDAGQANGSSTANGESSIDSESAATSLPSDGSCDDANPADMPPTDGPQLQSDATRAVYSALSQKPEHFDVLCAITELEAGPLSAALTMLELDELVERQVGDWYLRKAPKQSTNPIPTSATASLSQQTEARVSEIVDFITAAWDGISRKYLQNYVGVFWFLMGQSSRQPESLFDACLRSAPIAYRQIIGYVTPAMVKIGGT